jgi:hypothetical protein
MAHGSEASYERSHRLSADERALQYESISADIFAVSRNPGSSLDEIRLIPVRNGKSAKSALLDRLTHHFDIGALFSSHHTPKSLTACNGKAGAIYARKAN